MAHTPRRKNQGRRTSTPPIQRMGGKEERVSDVGKARARVERREARGEARFDVAPGPSTEELLTGPQGPTRAVPAIKVSRKPRAGPSELEPEIKASTPPKGSRGGETDGPPAESTPEDPGSPP